MIVHALASEIKIIRLGNTVMFLQNNPQGVCKSGQQNQKHHTGSLLSIRNICLSLFVLSLPFDTFVLLRLVSLISNSSFTVNLNVETSYYPTSIPWIEDSLSCEKSGRFWRNEKCWDSKHSPFF
jgi:hypothetical protein